MPIFLPDSDLNERLFAIASTREPPVTKTTVAREILRRVTADFDADNPKSWIFPVNRAKAAAAATSPPV